MTVCLDTNVFLQIFGHRQPCRPILRALLDGRITLALSTAILFEYEEVTTQLSGAQRWKDVAALLESVAELHGSVLRVEPSFRFEVIAADPDDNKFCDCAIAAGTDFVVTDDKHFALLETASFKPKPIKPDEFIRLYLT